MIMPRVAMPSRFRCLAEPLSDNATYPKLKPKSVPLIKRLHRTEWLLGQPYFYACEWAEVSSVPTPYLWTYPAPDEEEIFELPYYVWPDEMTTDTDIAEIPFEAEDTLKLFLDAYLGRFRKDPDWPILEGMAKESARDNLGATRSVAENGQRQMWTPEAEDESGIDDRKLASGEPAYE